MPMNAEEQEVVRAFRRQAQDARKAMSALDKSGGGLRMADGYIEIPEWLEQYRLLCVPVRRTFLETDKASFRSSAAILCEHPDPAVRLRAVQASETYEEVMGELDGEVVFGGQRVRRMTIVKTWLDAAVFHDSTALQKPYEEMLATLGRAIEGMAAEHTEELARAVLALDEAAALALDEPLVRPEPPPPLPPRPRGFIARLKAQLGLTRHT
jgi:hypothetical protein